MDNLILQAMADTVQFRHVLDLHIKGKGVNLTGLVNSAKSVFCVALANNAGGKSLVFCVNGREELNFYKKEFAYLCPDLPAVELYPRDLFAGQAEKSNPEIAAARTAAVRFMQGQSRGIVLVTAETFVQKQIHSKVKEVLTLQTGDSADERAVIATLGKYGYERCDQVDRVGQFAVRGGIVDVFAVGETNPLRLEWLDRTIESIRLFDCDTQRSVKTVQKTQVVPLFSDSANDQYDCSLLELCSDKTVVFFDEPVRFAETMEKLVRECDDSRSVFDCDSLLQKINAGSCLTCSGLDHHLFPAYTDVNISSRLLPSYGRKQELIREDLRGWLQDGKTPIIMLVNTMKARAFGDSLCHEGFPVVFDQDEIVRGKVNILSGTLDRGFEIWDSHWLLLTDNDLFGIKKRRSPYSKHQGAQLQYFTDIKAGDYVVHGVHGIGRYAGVRTIENKGLHTDYLIVVYAQEALLYIPVEQVGLLHKYVGNDGTIPRLSKMGGADWQKSRNKAAKAITILAEELLRLYARRQLTTGYAFAKDNNLQREFEEQFPFEETPDQTKAIAEIKKDMESPRPMDRLLCGDVGYGKTEVALRAAFKAVMDGKQVAVLAPTTVLTQQHYLTFVQRMKNFGPNVALLNRFTGRKEQKAILAKLAEGTVDVVIGTHRLLQSDVVFKDLGLLIIDEEQRFGVGQKEKIKKWCSGIDVLSLSATPIPRTLHLALVNGRDMSVIETPPEDRQPVETYVGEYNSDMVKSAIERELRRGGQIFYVHNRIENLSGIETALHKLVPGMRIQVAHGQMPEKSLEEAVTDFYNGDCDLLLSTTIVENGLDVPRANTIIIDGADQYGLSQLYQMRGRVGRSNRLAYAYLLYHKNKALSEIAQKRLEAVRDFTELGAGFKIAMRDLEIRGAGNILGAEQHGHIAGVGFHEYCTLLEQTIRRLRHESVGETIVQQPVLEIPADAYISDDFIDDPRYKLELYRRLVDMEFAQRDELLDEITDRFGTVPAEVLNLWRIACIRSLCRGLKIRGIHVHTGEMRITFTHESPVNTQALVGLADKYKNAIRITQSSEPVLIYRDRDIEKNALGWLEENLPVLV